MLGFVLALATLNTPFHDFMSKVEPSIILTNGKFCVSVLNVPWTLYTPLAVADECAVNPARSRRLLTVTS